MRALNAGDEVGGWTIERIVELGARTNLYLVSQGHDRALLRLLRSPEGAMADRLLRNVAVAYELNDRNVVRVRGVVQHEGCPGVLSTYFAKAHSILSWSQARRREIPVILEAFDGVFFGLKVLHEAGIVHRNLKPNKVLMVRGRTGSVAKIEDVLLSRAEGPDVPGAQVTAVGEIIGSPHYMPPEQHLAASKVDHRADLYAAGVILYETITGEHPFDGDRLVAIVKAKKKGVFRPASELRPDVVPALDQLIAELLSPDPDDRPSSADDVLDRLHNVWSATRPVAAERVMGAPRREGVSWLRRPVGRFAVGLLVLVAALAAAYVIASA